MSSQIEIIKEIIDGITDFKIIPFIGAGMSIRCGAMSWRDIIDELKKELLTEEEDYLLIAQQYEEKYGRKKLIGKLKEFCKLKYLNSDALEIHNRILCMNPPIIYTTNYDNAIESAAKLLYKDYNKIVTLKDIVQCPHGTKQIIKFHGDFDDDKSIVFTRNDYNERLNFEKHALNVQFRANILGKSIFFLGYSFNDENIKLVFEMHKQYYGANNLPKSYIVSFERNPQKEKELAEMNVLTIHLSSPQEFGDLINEIGTNVFNKSVESQFSFFNTPIPSLLLMDFELKDLKSYVDSTDYTPEQKCEKIKHTLENKEIPNDLEDAVCSFIQSIISGDYANKTKQGMMMAFVHTNIRRTANVLTLCKVLISLSDNSYFTFFINPSDFKLDVMGVIQMKLGNAFRTNPDFISKTLCTLILSYMAEKISKSQKLLPEQFDRFLFILNCQKYNTQGDLDETLTEKHIENIVSYHKKNAVYN